MERNDPLRPGLPFLSLHHGRVHLPQSAEDAVRLVSPSGPQDSAPHAAALRHRPGHQLVRHGLQRSSVRPVAPAHHGRDAAHSPLLRSHGPDRRRLPAVAAWLSGHARHHRRTAGRLRRLAAHGPRLCLRCRHQPAVACGPGGAGLPWPTPSRVSTWPTGPWAPGATARALPPGGR